MAATGHITAEQLCTVVQAIMDKVVKVTNGEQIVSAQLGDLTVTYNYESDGLSISRNGGSALITSVSSVINDDRYIVTVGSDNKLYTEELDSQTLNVGVLQNAGVFGGIKEKFCLPNAPSEYRTLANDPRYGGGVLLTTRYRAYEPVVHNITSEQGANVVVHPYVYTVVTGADAVSVSFGENANNINEYWLDIDFPGMNEPTVVFADFANDKKIIWSGEGEPDWSTLGGRRIQIHILAGMASYVISARTSNVAEE